MTKHATESETGRRLTNVEITPEMLGELEDFFVDLRGAFTDARAGGGGGVSSALGSRFEIRVRDFAERLEALSEAADLLRNPS